MDRLLEVLSDKSNRNAHFKTVITINIKGNQYNFTGIAKGQISLARAGNEGFGYDPIFQPEGYEKTFAELSSALKNQISHRGKATQLLISFLKNEK